MWVLMCVRLLECVHAIAWVSKALRLECSLNENVRTSCAVHGLVQPCVRAPRLALCGCAYADGRGAMLGWGSVDGAGNYTGMGYADYRMVYASWVSEKSMRIAMPYSNVWTGGCASVNGNSHSNVAHSSTHIFECTHKIRQWP